MGFQERFLRTEQNIQLTYELQHRINAAVSFPTLAPNGSNVLVYAHESGIRILWRGGRKFAPSKAPTPTNGKPKPAVTSQNDSIMIIDSSDDDEPAGLATKAPVYEVKFEDDEAEFDPTKPFPEVLTYVDIHFGTEATELVCSEKVEGKIVIAAACADCTVRLVTLPLTPPGPEQQKAANKVGKWNETIHVLMGFSTPPDLVAVTYQKSTAAYAFPTLLVASHSREVTGLLLLHTVAVSSTDRTPTSSVAACHSGPTQTQCLPSPASSLDFNHSNSTLLLGFQSGCIRLYSPTTSSWLITLHASFASPSPAASPSASNSTRKAVLDAKYVLNGKAITVLLSDGGWGVWDIGGTGPSSSKSILSQCGIKGGALTPFAISGYIDGPPAKSSHKSSTISTQSKFAPMTPATRKTIDVAAGLKSGTNNGNATKGRISVQPLKGDEITAKHDDRVAFWIEEAYAVIPSLRSYWSSKTSRGGSLFGSSGSSSSRMQKIEGVNLRGEKCTGFAQSTQDNELIVVGEHRVVFVGDLPSSKTQKHHRIDNVLVEGGEMDTESSGGLDDLDRSLDLMEERRVTSAGLNFGQSFGSSNFGTSRGSGFGDSFRSFDSTV